MVKNRKKDFENGKKLNSDSHDEVQKLKKLVAKHEASIAALTSVIGDLLSAHAATQKDVRLVRIIGDSFRHNLQRYESGGTERVEASVFGARCDAFGEVLESAARSVVLEKYWYRSVFRRREEKQLKSLRYIRDQIYSELDTSKK